MEQHKYYKIMNNKVSFLVLMSVMIFFSCSNDDLSQPKTKTNAEYELYVKDALEAMGMSRPTDSYNYPFLPGMEEWKTLQSSKEMVDTCQVPVDLLKTQSTQAVIQDLWEFPFFDSWGEESSLCYTFQDHILNIVKNLNAYKELNSRKDAAQCLFNRYKVMPVNLKLSFYRNDFELLFSQPQFIAQLSKEDKLATVKEALAKDASLKEKSKGDWSYFPNAAHSCTCFLIGRIMQNANYEPFVQLCKENELVARFVEFGFEQSCPSNPEADKKVFELIIQHGEDYSK